MPSGVTTVVTFGGGPASPMSVPTPSRWPSLTWRVPLMTTFGSFSSVVVSSRAAFPPLPVTWEGSFVGSVVVSSRAAFPPLPVTWEGSLAGPVVVSSRAAPEPGFVSWLGAV